MGYLLTVGCYLVAFAPATALFLRLAASDPLKVILFGCGSFVWLVSLLLTSIVWTALVPLQDHLWISLIASIVFQEAARVVCFFVLRAAQKGLASMANPTSAQHVRITGVMSLANSRHLLAVVIGLGMGAVAALFLTMNAFDAISGSGVVGGLKQTLDGTRLRSSFPRLLPLHWAINAMLLSMLHVVWTVLVWDSCHHFAIRRDAAAAAASTAGQSASGSATASTPLLQNEHQQWWMPALIAVGFHFASSFVSYLSSSDWAFTAISIKLFILISLVFYCYSIVRHDTPIVLLKEIAFALRDWVTLAELRKMCSKKEGEAAPAAEMNRGREQVVIRDGSNTVLSCRLNQIIFIGHEMAEYVVADAENDWRNDPVAVHILTLASGKKIMIEMYYDRRQISHCNVNDFKVVTDLCDLCTNFEFVEESDKFFMTTLSMQIGNTDWKNSNLAKNIARFRFGPQIAQSIGENEVVGYGMMQSIVGCEHESITTVRMEVRKDKDNSEYSDRIRADFLPFIDQSSSRHFELEGSTFAAPAEILSLHSEYFFTLFYRDFAEKNENIIKLDDILACDYANLRNVFFLPINQNTLKMDFVPVALRLLDRFSCIDLFKKVEVNARTMSETLVDENSFHWVIELAEVLNDKQILVNYLDRFPLTDCLNSLVEKNLNVMTQISTLLLTQRMSAVARSMSNRPKVRFVFTQGEVVCALFGDPQSQALTHFLDLIRGGNAVADEGTVANIPNGVCIGLREPLEFNLRTPLPLFASSPTLLHYGSYNGHHRIFFLSKHAQCFPVMGVMVSGQNIIRTVTKLMSISIES